MARIKILKVPNGLGKSQFGGQCPEGQKQDEFGNCVPDFDAQPAQQGFGTRTDVDYSSMLPNFSNAVGQRAYKESKGMSTNPWKTTGNEGTASNPMDQSKVQIDNTKKSKGLSSTRANNILFGADVLGTAASVGFNMWDQNKKQKDFNKWQNQSLLPDNYYAVNTSQDRGDYDVNNGIFQANKMGYKSKGTQANAYQAQQNFTKYGGSLPYAAEGIAVQGDTNVRAAMIPQSSTYIPSMPTMGTSTSVPVSAPRYKAEPESEMKGSIKNIIAQKESGGNYKALPKKKDGTLASSAVGKYQFLWNQNKDWIGKITGVTTKEGFMNNPEAQEAAFDYWDKTVLTPNAQKIKDELGVNVPLNNIKYSIHFAGPKGAYDYFKTGKETVDAFGSTISKYAGLKHSQNGGQNNNNMKIRIVGTPNQMAYGGMYATGGEPCPPGYAWDGDPADGGGGCVKLPEGVPQPGTTNPPVNANQPMPIMPSVPSGGGSISGSTTGGGFRGGFNLKGTNYGFNYGLDTAPDMKSDMVHHAGVSFPNLFNAGQNKGGLDIKGMYAPNKSWSSNIVAGIPLSAKGASKLSVTGGLKQAIGNMPPQGMPPGMMAAPAGGNPLNWNAAVGYKGKLGKKGPEFSINASYDKAYGGEFAQGGQSPYSGQSDYGLYIGQRNLYKTMAKHPYEHTNNSVTQDDNSKSPYVLEAEGGETILRPDGSHMNITGKRHSEGGEKLNKEQAPEGSFIFSDTKKMRIKDPAVLKNFGKTSGNPTPAEVAKQYDVNKYMGILQDPNTDVLSKNTARRMIDTYQKKLAELSLVQEQMKGFPQGIPDVAKGAIEAAQGTQAPIPQGAPSMMGRFGGVLPKAVDGVNVPPTAQNFMGPLFSDKLIPWHGDKYQNKANASKYSSRQWADKLAERGYTGNYDPVDVQKFIYGQPEGKQMVDALHTKHKGIIYGGPKENRYDAKLGYRWDDALDAIPIKTKPQAEGDGYGGPDEEDYGDYIPETTVETTLKQDMDLGNISVPGGDPIQDNLQRRWTSQNRRDLINAGLDYASLKKYHPRTTTIQPVLPEFIPQDWRGYAASLQSGQNAAANQMGTYQPGQSMASNLSFLQGQSAEGLGKYITGVDQYNATGASNMDLQRANILNQYTQANAAGRDKDWMDENTLDAKYREAERVARKGVVKATDIGEDVASKLYNQNLTEKYFKLDPRTQTMVFKDDNAKAAWEAETSGTPDPGSGARDVARFKEIYDSLSYLPADERMEAAKTLYTGNAIGKTTSKKYPLKPEKNSETTTSETTSKYGGRV